MRLLSRLRRHAPTRAFRAAALLAIAGLVAAPTVLAGAPVRAETPVAAEESGQPDAAVPTILAGARDSILLAGTREVVFDVVLSNPSEQELPAGRVELRLDAARVDAAVGLGDDTAPKPGTGALLGEATVGATARGEQQQLAITVPISEFPLSAASTPGVYRVGVAHYANTSRDRSAAAEPDATGSTSVLWRSPGGSADTVQLSAILPIVLPAEVRTMPTKAQLSSATETWTPLLAEARDERATLAIDPRVIAGIRALGDDAPESALAFLSELEAYPHSTFLLQFADADPAAQASLGMKELLAPKTLDFASRNGTFPAADPQDPGAGETPGPTASPSPTPSEPAAGTNGQDAADAKAGENSEGADGAEPGAAPLPSLESLLDWPAGTPTAWPAEGEVSAGTLELLKNSDAGTVVLDSGNVRATGGPRATLDGAPTVIIDREIRLAGRDALASTTDAGRRAGEARLISELALAAQGRSAGVVLGLDRGSTAENGAGASELLGRVGDLPWVKRTAVADQRAGTATLVAAEPLEERRELLRSALSREAGIVEHQTLLKNPEYLVGYQRARLLNFFATRYASADSGFAEVAARYRSRDAELLRGVQAISTEHTQLVGASTRVPVQVRNSLPFDAIVDVEAVPSSAALSVDESRFPGVVVPAGSNVRVLVPVQSRVSSGESGLVVSITAQGGKPTVFTGTLQISISTVVETVGLVVVLTLAVLLLGFGIWRSIRRKRKPASGDTE
ncbi:hypothetical protein JD292_07775 [Leucobacter sp. CSA2]|uniref:Secreted protein n=1 Tax=Leucobacter edaphi TaxID=2796472 RepID=A0A934QCJ5_9MICO|nr:DUF6049 family protein [Leucobacter edaphi]MBK0421973.1 hypothetical protein [Leucobacter edaphi]